jgi:hypothetical protein
MGPVDQHQGVSTQPTVKHTTAHSPTDVAANEGRTLHGTTAVQINGARYVRPIHLS